MSPAWRVFVKTARLGPANVARGAKKMESSELAKIIIKKQKQIESLENKLKAIKLVDAIYDELE